ATFACTEISSCSGVPAVGLFGVSVNPGPCRKSLHPAPSNVSARMAPALEYVFIAVPRVRLVKERDLHDPSPRQRRVEPVNAPVGVLFPAQVHLRVVAAVIGPELQVAAG